MNKNTHTSSNTAPQTRNSNLGTQNPRQAANQEPKTKNQELPNSPNQEPSTNNQEPPHSPNQEPRTKNQELPNSPNEEPKTKNQELPLRITKILSRATTLEKHVLAPGRLTLTALADAAPMPRSSLHHAVKQLRIVTQLERRATGRGRRYATISREEAETVLTFVLAPRPSVRSAAQPAGPKPYARHGLGHLYIVQLEPRLDAGRIKVGWTGALGSRLSKFLCSTPFGEYLHHWPCLRQWELTAREYITRYCEHIRQEVYRTRDLHAVLARAAHFFVEMPDPTRPAPSATLPKRHARRKPAKSKQ